MIPLKFENERLKEQLATEGRVLTGLKQETERLREGGAAAVKAVEEAR